MLLAQSTKNRKKQIKKLANEMNKRNDRLLPVVSPIIDLMDFMLEDEEIEYLTKLNTSDYSYDHLLQLSDKPTDKFESFMDVLLKKGFIMVNVDEGGIEYFGLSPIIVGWIEMAEYYHRGRTNEEQFQYKLNELFKYFRKFNVNPLRSLVNRFGPKVVKATQEVLLYHPENGKRKIPIDKKILHPGYEIHPHKTINDLIEERAEKDAIYAAGCVCRNVQKGLGNPCSFDIPVDDSCLFFGDRGFGYTAKRAGYGRKISKEEARDILQKTSEKGAIHAVFHEEDDLSTRSEIALCNSCLDCCGLLRGYNLGSMISNYRCYYYSRVADLKLCVGCGKCVKHCPTLAISLHNDKVFINKDRCIGCAQCTIQCPQDGVLTLVPETRDVMLPWLTKSERRFSA
ncbi:MAG: 4Fe-4S binding protein [Desulfobacteraceae bacterium]|nr:4Fe-4S binding protein [Desulfobacteraceae bacterium]MBC2756534.1 4Fe-4S binding protein [Desulfobacteraceae bacterium]